MTSSISKQVSWYLDYYGRFVDDWWSQIGFWDYVCVMLFCLWMGWMMLRGPVQGRC